VQHYQASLLLWAILSGLMLYALLRRKWSWFQVLPIFWFLLLGDVFAGLNMPNPNNIRLIQVVIP